VVPRPPGEVRAHGDRPTSRSTLALRGHRSNTTTARIPSPPGEGMRAVFVVSTERLPAAAKQRPETSPGGRDRDRRTNVADDLGVDSHARSETHLHRDTGLDR